MKKEVKIAWLAGLFEGEGTFNILNDEKSKGMGITSTDKDVLEKVKKWFGGNIYPENRKTKKHHWKDGYVWKLNNTESIELYNEIKPFLCKRRVKRGDEFIQKINEMNDKIEQKKNDVINKRNKMRELFNEGYNHTKIAKIIGCDRSYVSHVLKGKRF